mmetsp:Transcript_36230/g.90422  ORF Transcript_36230/g.90422 Transcript_36230/m.90422 type:complete len:95 (-) Transcript_36230:2575-2859(-)
MARCQSCALDQSPHTPPHTYRRPHHGKENGGYLHRWTKDIQTYRQFHDSAWRFDMRTPHVHTHHLLIHPGRQAGRQPKGKQTSKQTTKHVCVNV